MTISPGRAKPWIAAAALLYAIVGFTPIAGPSCSMPFVKDPETEEWREATPAELGDAVQQAVQAIAQTTTGTPTAVVMPWLDLATRLLAIFLAFRWRAPSPQPVINTPDMEK